MEGPLQLNITPRAALCSHKPQAAGPVPSVRVAQSHAEYAVIEVTCPCGQTTYVRCDYGAAGVPSAPQEPAP